MREFGCLAIWVGLGMMVVGLLMIGAHPHKGLEPYILPLIYIGGWFSFIGCLVSLIGSAWPYKKRKQGTST